MIRLLLASEVLGLLCSHTDWTAPIPTGSLRSQEIRARPDPRLFILGLERSLTKGGGWVEVMNRGVTFHPDPRLLLLPLLLQLPACPPGGFSSLSTLGSVAHRRLGDSILNRCCSGRARSPHGAVRRSTQSCTEWTYLSFATLCTETEDFCRHFSILFFVLKTFPSL